MCDGLARKSIMPSRNRTMPLEPASTTLARRMASSLYRVSWRASTARAWARVRTLQEALGFLLGGGHGLRPLADDRDHRPFLRLGDGLVHGADRGPDGLAEMGHGDLVRAARFRAEAVQELGEDDARIAPRAFQGGGGDGRGRDLVGPVRPHPLDDGPDGRGEVGARVRVGDGEDVDPVELLLVLQDPLGAGQEGIIIGLPGQASASDGHARSPINTPSGAGRPRR